MNYQMNNIPYSNPYLSNPYSSQTNPYKNEFYCNRQELVRVNGLEGAKAYQMQANSVVALFDANDDYFYLKQTDGAGFGSIRTFKFEELHNLSKNQENNTKTEQYITRQEMEDYVKQFIQKNNNKSDTTGNRPSKNDNVKC